MMFDVIVWLALLATAGILVVEESFAGINMTSVSSVRLCLVIVVWLIVLWRCQLGSIILACRNPHQQSPVLLWSGCQWGT